MAVYVNKVLIVDDEVDFTQMVKINLEETNKFEVVIQNDGSKALETALEYKPDIIL